MPFRNWGGVELMSFMSIVGLMDASFWGPNTHGVIIGRVVHVFGSV